MERGQQISESMEKRTITHTLKILNRYPCSAIFSNTDVAVNARAYTKTPPLNFFAHTLIWEREVVPLLTIYVYLNTTRIDHHMSWSILRQRLRWKSWAPLCSLSHASTLRTNSFVDQSTRWLSRAQGAIDSVHSIRKEAINRIQYSGILITLVYLFF